MSILKFCRLISNSHCIYGRGQGQGQYQSSGFKPFLRCSHSKYSGLYCTAGIHCVLSPSKSISLKCKSSSSVSRPLKNPCCASLSLTRQNMRIMHLQHDFNHKPKSTVRTIAYRNGPSNSFVELESHWTLKAVEEVQVNIVECRLQHIEADGLACLLVLGSLPANCRVSTGASTFSHPFGCGVWVFGCGLGYVVMVESECLMLSWR